MNGSARGPDCQTLCWGCPQASTLQPTPSVPTGNTWLQTMEQGMAQPGQEVLCGRVVPDCALVAWLGSGSLAHSWGAWECSFSF